MERKFTFVPEQFYHVYNRGVERRLIFSDDHDKYRFQRLLYLSNGEKPVTFKLIQGDPLDKDVGEKLTSIVAYAIMGNHFHLILYEHKMGGISKFMGKLSTAYSMYFNIKNERSGPLLCRPFRAKYIADDDYLRWVLSYVHLNPLDLVEAGWKERGIGDMDKVMEFLASYPFSSYCDFFGTTRIENKILNKTLLSTYVKHLESLDAMMKDFRDTPDNYDPEIW